jgi:isoleucyl-tRNA synthetase
MDIQGQKQAMLDANAATSWTPDALRTGRFNNIIEQAPDWNLSRDRYWATPIPVWKGERSDGTVIVKVIGSYKEFEELTGKKLDDYHLPEVMNVTFELDGTTMKHIGKVLDCWFESGSMTFAQFHYPFENKEKFESSFPADFIIEAIDQTRGWFYSLLAVNVGLFGKAPWKNLICTGFINAADGKKMSKKLKNYTDPMELMNKFSADSFRFLMLSSPLTNGENFALDDKDVGNVARKLSMVWNMYDFFTMYAEVDEFTFPYDTSSSDAFLIRGTEKPFSIEVDVDKLKNPLDIWIISRLHQLVTEVEERTEAYDLQNALKPILPFIDDASNWFVRRSRRRFWKSEDDTDKSDAYKTLHYVLVRLAYVLAPFAPFMAEELYHNLTGDNESIHLKDWLPAGHINELVMNEMETVRNYVNEGLSLRAKAGVKVRQPLTSVIVPNTGKHVDFESILIDELNVKHVKTGKQIAIDENLTPELKREGMMREIIRHIQAARKNAGLNVDDRIILCLTTDDKELQQAIDEHKTTIVSETLTEKMENVVDNQKRVTIDGKELTICLKKA